MAKRVILISFLAALILSLFIPAAQAEERYWLNDLEGDRVILHYAKDIPLAEARLIVAEYERAIRFVQQRYPLPYPAHPNVEQFLVTSWGDYTFAASFRHTGMTHVHISPPSLYMGDFFRVFLLPVAGRHFLPGLSQLLFCRYMGENPHILGAVALGKDGTPKLSELYTWYGSGYDSETAMYLSASFLGYLEETFGWDRLIGFIPKSGFEGSLEKDLAAWFGKTAEELQSGWLKDLRSTRVPSAARMTFDRERFQQLTNKWQALAMAYNRGELVTEYTLCRLLARDAGETESFERALDRFDSAIFRATWFTRLCFLLPVVLFLIHLAGYLLRKRRMVQWFRARVKHTATESMVSGLSGHKEGA